MRVRNDENIPPQEVSKWMSSKRIPRWAKKRALMGSYKADAKNGKLLAGDSLRNKQPSGQYKFNFCCIWEKMGVQDRVWLVPVLGFGKERVGYERATK